MVINRVSNNVIGDVIYDIINVISLRRSWGSLWFFLFLVHIRFLSNLSTIEVIRNCYRNGIVKLVRKFEKLCLRKGKHHFMEKQYWFGIRNQKLSKSKGVGIREREMKKGTSPKLCNTGLVFNRVSLTSWEESASLALVGHLVSWTHSLTFWFLPFLIWWNDYIFKSTLRRLLWITQLSKT